MDPLSLVMSMIGSSIRQSFSPIVDRIMGSSSGNGIGPNSSGDESSQPSAGTSGGQTTLDQGSGGIINQIPQSTYPLNTIPVSVGTNAIPASSIVRNPKSDKELEGFDGLLDGFFPKYDSDENTNEKYEDYFRQGGMSDDDIATINDRGGWFDVHASNPAIQYAVDDLGHNPFLDMNIDDLRESISKETDSLASSGNFLPAKNLPQYDDSSTIGSTITDPFIDNGMTMDYDHLTADDVTGSAMQKYGELGMGGRGWWLYDPDALYKKSDEQQDFGFVPYLPDQTSKANMVTSQAVDAWNDIMGAIGRSRELLTDYNMSYNDDGETKSISGSDWDFRSTPYLRNMGRMITNDPLSLLTKPENDQIHGAPVTTMVLEHEFQDRDGSKKYAYGDLVENGYDLILTYDNGDVIEVPQSEYEKWGRNQEGQLELPEEYVDGFVSAKNDDSLHLKYSDGQDIHVPKEVYEQWEGSRIPESPYVPIEKAKGFLPENIDSLNEGARKRVKDNGISDAPVLYMPDLVMDDGTRIGYYQAYDMSNDSAGNMNSGTTYDFGPLGIAKPRRLSGEIVNDDMSINLGDMLNNAYDFTMGSLPISISQIAWPTSIAKATKALAGIDPNKYDPLTGADSYISAERDEKTGELKSTANDIQQLSSIVGNALVPLTEELAGPISGSSLIGALSGDIPMNPSMKQLVSNFLLGALGEGLEEVAGNLFEEVTSQGDAAFGDVTDKDGNRLLDDDGNPILNDNGEYKYQDANGNPYTYMTDPTGHTYKDRTTPIDRRLANFLNPNDLANAFAGGVLVDAAMQAVPVLRNVPGAVKRDLARKHAGVNQYVETDRDRLRADAASRGEQFDITQGENEIDPEYEKFFDRQLAR